MKLKGVLLSTACIIVLVVPAFAGGRYEGGSSSWAGARASASASARAASYSSVRSTNVNRNYNTNTATGGNATATGGNATAAGGAGGRGGSSSVINAIDTGGHGSWWQGTSATVIPPAMASNGTCADSISFGIAVGPGGLSFGVPAPNRDCNIREDAKTYMLLAQTRGRARERNAAWRVMCLSDRAQQAGICK